MLKLNLYEFIYMLLTLLPSVRFVQLSCVCALNLMCLFRPYDVKVYEDCSDEKGSVGD